MMNTESHRVAEILLVEDNAGDARLAVEALAEGSTPHRLSIVKDGVEALSFLRQQAKHANAPRPDLILLDLNLPKKDGWEVLAELKEDPGLKTIPVVVLTTSEAEEDIAKSYRLYVNCYITKPIELEHFTRVMGIIQKFWLSVVKRLPRE
jgi:two-component system, chemotaxis family, response regulator Rcp1